MRVDAKIRAREWILNAIQNHPCIPNKDTEREIRKFVERLQRDLRQLNRSKELFMAVNSQDAELQELALKSLSEQVPKSKKARKNWKRQKLELRRLIDEQRKDVNDRKVRFEHANSK